MIAKEIARIKNVMKKAVYWIQNVMVKTAVGAMQGILEGYALVKNAIFLSVQIIMNVGVDFAAQH